MPFGQAFWFSRIVGGIVEGVTGDKELARGVRVATRWGLAILTLDPLGGAADAVVDHFTDSAVDHLADGAVDHLADTAAEHASSTAVEHLTSVDPHFGSKILRSAAAALRTALLDPQAAVEHLLDYGGSSLTPEVSAALEGARHGTFENAQEALTFAKQHMEPATFTRLIAKRTPEFS